MIWCACKRIIEGGFGGDAMKTALNPSEARPGRRAENEREGTQITKYLFLRRLPILISREALIPEPGLLNQVI